jgi:hypothetical protein
MTRTEALERVAEAARVWINGTSNDAIRNMMAVSSALAVLDALDALPPAAPEPVGEVVEVRAAIYHKTDDSSFLHVWLEPGDYSQMVPTPHPDRWKKFATIRARVPLPVVPEVVGEVEG